MSHRTMAPVATALAAGFFAACSTAPNTVPPRDGAPDVGDAAGFDAQRLDVRPGDDVPGPLDGGARDDVAGHDVVGTDVAPGADRVAPDVAVADSGLASATGELAREADAFVDSIGVNVHLNYLDLVYGTGYTTIVRPALLGLGVRHLRDGLNDWPEVYTRMQELATHGIHFTAVCGPADPNTESSWDDATPCITGGRAMGSALEAFEGDNEPDNNAGSNWISRYRRFQTAMYTAVHHDATLSAYPVITGALAGPDRPLGVGDLSSAMDYGNVHSYPINGRPTCPETPSDSLATNLTNERTVAGTKPVIATETGYHNCLDRETGLTWWYGISEAAAARYLPRIYLEYFNAGVVRTFLYEFIDEHATPTDTESNYGLLHNDGTPKPAYTVVQRLIARLADPGPRFAPGHLDYTLTGGGAGVHHTLLEARDGRFFLVLWQDAVSWNYGPTGAGTDVAVAPVALSITLTRTPSTIQVFAPLTSATAISHVTATSHATVQVADAPVVVEFDP